MPIWGKGRKRVSRTHDGRRWARTQFARWYVRRCKKGYVEELGSWPIRIVTKHPPKYASRLRQARI